MKLSSLLAVPLVLAMACAPHIEQLGVTSPGSDHPWVVALTTAQQASQEGNFGMADSVLAEFGERHSDAPEAAEALYWRGFYQLDPANAGGSSARAAAAFETYLQSQTPIMHQAEAQALLRIASRLDSLEQPILAAAPEAGGARPAARPAASRNDEEVTRLREELRRTNEELERIRRRLATPRPDEQPTPTPPAQTQTPPPPPPGG